MRRQPARGGGLVDRRRVQVGRLLGDDQRAAQRARARAASRSAGRARRPSTASRARARGPRRRAARPSAAAARRGSAARRRGRPRRSTGPARAATSTSASRALERQRAAGRVLERRHRVEQPGAVARGQRGDGLGVEAVVVARHRDDLGAGELERLERGEVGRLLDQHAVAGLEQHGRDQRQRLLRAARDQQRRRRAVGRPRAVSRAAISARSAGSPSVVEYCSVRPAGVGQRGGERRRAGRARRTARARAARRRTR